MAREPHREEPAATTPRPHDKNPRNNPDTRMDASSPQPNAPPQSPAEEMQDQQPVDPKPIIHQAQNPSRGTREERNG